MNAPNACPDAETATDRADALVGRYIRTTWLLQLDGHVARMWEADAIHGLVVQVAAIETLPAEVRPLTAELVAASGQLYAHLASLEAAYMELAQLMAAAPVLANGLPSAGVL